MIGGMCYDNDQNVVRGLVNDFCYVAILESI
jgi:hypothetical protein